MKYYEAGNATEKEELRRQAQRVIRRAPNGSHIYAVNSYLEVFAESNEPDDEEPQRDYLREFERRFRELSYHRLIQLKNGDRPIQLKNGGRRSAGSTPLAQRLTKAYLEHYRSIVNGTQRDHGNVLKLEEVNATIPTSFVVVKHGIGGEPMYGITAVHDFYLHRRDVAQGHHTIESVVTETGVGFCWGTFAGTSTSGHPLAETFADWYQFHHGRIRGRRSFFYRPAI